MRRVLRAIELAERVRIDGRGRGVRQERVRRVRAEGPWADLPVIALSGHTQPHEIEAGREAGFTDYVQKFEREALFVSLRQCLAAHQDVPVAA